MASNWHCSASGQFMPMLPELGPWRIWADLSDSGLFNDFLDSTDCSDDNLC
jgi:hypothetical protein